MNKQELIDILKRQLKVMPGASGGPYDGGYEYATKHHLAMIANLDEPEKPVVPQYVANFYESIKDDFEDGVYELCKQLYNCDLDGRINFWFGCNDNKPIETLVMMHKFGYEIEKEKLYTVEIPNPNGFIRLVLCKDCDGKLFVATFSGGDCWENFGKCKLTESEIKEDFGWAWQFAKEVENK